MTALKTTDVIVVGSLNHDVVTTVERHPTAGETVLAASIDRGNGGKGGNQAVAAAAAGARVAMVGAVGDDAEGNLQIVELGSHRIDTAKVMVNADVSTSFALVTLTPDGENSIIVTPGANDLLTNTVVADQLAGQRAAVVLAQSEIGGSGCDAAALYAEQTGARFVFSNGPVAWVSDETWAACDPLVVNVHEARDVLRARGHDADGVPDLDLARVVSSSTGAKSVVVTLGSGGSVVGPVGDEGSAFVHIGSHRVAEVVDTTGAGDTYCGVVAAGLALGQSLADACTAGSLAAARSVGWLGARPPVAV